MPKPYWNSAGYFLPVSGASQSGWEHDALPCFTLVSPSKKQLFSPYTALQKQWKWPQHPARSFCLGICWPTKAAKHNYEVPKPNINKGSSNIRGASFRACFKNKIQKRQWECFAAFSMLWAWMLPRVVERIVHMTLELHAAAVQGEAWSIWGSCYSRRKAVPQEWKQSFLWLLTNLCHTFLLLVPYNWAHWAVMRNWMDRQVK